MLIISNKKRILEGVKILTYFFTRNVPLTGEKKESSMHPASGRRRDRESAAAADLVLSDIWAVTGAGITWAQHARVTIWSDVFRRFVWALLHYNVHQLIDARMQCRKQPNLKVWICLPLDCGHENSTFNRIRTINRITHYQAIKLTYYPQTHYPQAKALAEGIKDEVK